MKNPTEESETSDASIRVIGITASCFAGGIVVSLIAARLFLAAEGTPTSADAAQQATVDFRGGAGRRTSVQDSWIAIEAQGHADSGYGWIDRKAGTVRLPIDRAMDLIAERSDDPRP